MTSNIQAYPPDLTTAESDQLFSSIKDWSIANGLTVRPQPSILRAETDPRGILATTAPVTLFPSPFPRICFEQAKAIQTAYNRLYASIAQDEGFLEDIVKELARLCLQAFLDFESSSRFNHAIHKSTS